MPHAFSFQKTFDADLNVGLTSTLIVVQYTFEKSMNVNPGAIKIRSLTLCLHDVCFIHITRNVLIVSKNLVNISNRIEKTN